MRLFIKICIVLLSCSSLMAQSRTELQKRKKQLLEEIELSNSVLDQTLADKNVSVHQLKALKQKIAIRSQLIRTIQSEVAYIKEEIELSTRQQERLVVELDSLKLDYSILVQQAYKSSRHFNRLLFLFSSNVRKVFLSDNPPFGGFNPISLYPSLWQNVLLPLVFLTFHVSFFRSHLFQPF